MKILVTGSKGFIGTKLVPYLLSHKHEVIGIDQYILSEENYCRADISILGELLHIFQCNTFDLVQPKNHYAMQKLFGEKMVIKELKNYIIVRPFMIYGIGEKQNNYRSVISKFIKLSINNNKLPVHKNSYRSWLHITDFLIALNLLIENNINGTYNIGNGNEILPIDDIAKIIINKIGKGIIEYVDIPLTRTAYKIGDFSKLKKLGFNPSIKIENGIDELIKDTQKK